MIEPFLCFQPLRKASRGGSYNQRQLLPFRKKSLARRNQKDFFSKDFFKRIFFGMKISKVRLFVIQKQNNSSGTHLNGIVVWKSAYEGVLDVEMSTIHLFTGSTTHQLAY